MGQILTFGMTYGLVPPPLKPPFLAYSLSQPANLRESPLWDIGVGYTGFGAFMDPLPLPM